MAPRIAVALSALLLSCCAYAASPEPPKDKAKNATKSTAADKRGTDEMPLAVKILPAPDAQAKANEDQKERDKKAVAESAKALVDEALVEWTRSLFFATAFLAVFAAVQVALFVWQLRLIRDGTQDAKAAAEAAKDSADATKASVLLAKETAQRQLRAYLFVKSATIKNVGVDTR